MNISSGAIVDGQETLILIVFGIIFVVGFSFGMLVANEIFIWKDRNR